MQFSAAICLKFKQITNRCMFLFQHALNQLHDGAKIEILSQPNLAEASQVPTLISVLWTLLWSFNLPANLLIIWIFGVLMWNTAWKEAIQLVCLHGEKVQSKQHIFIQIKLCQRQNRPKALSTLTHSTPLVQSKSFNKLWNFGQTSAWFCLAKGEKKKEQLWQIHV